MTELTPPARKLRTVYFSATTDRDDTRAWWNKVAETAEAELAARRLSQDALDFTEATA